MNEKLFSKFAPEAIGPYSQAIKAGDTIYLSGMMPIDPVTKQLAPSDIEEQTKQILKNIDGFLKDVGYSVEDVVKTTCFLYDMNDFVAFNKLYGEYFTSNPARSCIAVKSLPKGALVEIEVIAYRQS